MFSSLHPVSLAESTSTLRTFWSDQANATNRHNQSMPGVTEMQTFRVSNLSNQVNQQNKIFPDIRCFVDYFCEDPAKAKPIHKILVATNGIAAVKCILSIRKLLMQLFKNDRIIKFICLTTEQEVQSKAEYIKMADDVVFSPAGANTNNYANVDEIVEHAELHKVDAVWAGWGHASENPRLPEELTKRGIAFIGPPHQAMFALGDKIASTIIAQTVNIPTIQWSGSGLTVPGSIASSSSATASDVYISQELYNSATVNSVEEGLACLKANNIGYPVMIKASEGGGGKGIRKCINDDEFELNFRRVQTEVPGSPVFLMKCMEHARHIEVQLIADSYGNVIPIFTRDCSIQRRCQKIIEEAPAGIAPSHILRSMQQDAVNLAKRVGYVSAGTVEYMYLPDKEEYYFLELNPRLQVEHPCTEMIANINIPAIQLQVAMGIPLHRIVEIRLFFGLDRYGLTSLPEDQIRTDTNIHVIAARITSEDPAEGFRPASGCVEVLNFQSNQNVWGYFSVSSTGKVHEFADSQFGHLFAKGTTRHEAIAALMCALNELELRATFQSQVNYLVGLLRDPDFENNTFHTGWLDARIAAKVQSSPEHPLPVTIAVGSTVIAHSRMAEVFSKFRTSLQRGQILSTADLTETWELELVHKNIKFSVLVNRYGPSDFVVSVNNTVTHTTVRQMDTAGGLLVTYADQSFHCHLDEETERFKVFIGSTMTVFDKENDPLILRSSNAGRLVKFLKKAGEFVKVGEVYAEIESMKMVINLEIKKIGGFLEPVASPGQVLFPGTLIANLGVQGDVTHARPEPYEEAFPEWVDAEEQRHRTKVRLSTRFENLVSSCNHILSGYAVPEHMFPEYVNRLVDDLFDVLIDPRLPFVLSKVVLNVVKSRINHSATYERLLDLISDENVTFDAKQFGAVLESYLNSVNPSDAVNYRSYFDQLQKVCDNFKEGADGHRHIVIKELFETYLTTERNFQEVTYDKGVANICSEVAAKNDDAWDRVVRMVYSHSRIDVKNQLLQAIMSRLSDDDIVKLQPTLKEFSRSFNVESEKLTVFACSVLQRVKKQSYDQLCSNLSRKSSRRNLQELVTDCSGRGGEIMFKDIVKEVNGTAEHQTVLHEFFFTPNTVTNHYAIKHFIKSAFHVEEAQIQVLKSPPDQTDASFFKFHINQQTPLYKSSCHHNKDVVFFLSVLRKLDLLKRDEIILFLTQHAEQHAHNIFLFVAYPSGENGYSTAMHMEEPELRKLGITLRDEVALVLQKAGVNVDGVDLMISRPQNPPIYTQHEFSFDLKLQLYRLPDKSIDISADHSPYMVFKFDDNGVQRLFVRHLMRMSSPQAVNGVKNQCESLSNKFVDVLEGACNEVRVLLHQNKIVTYDCNHILICVDHGPNVSINVWSNIIKEKLYLYQRALMKLRITEVEVLFTTHAHTLESYRAIYSNETGAIPEFNVYQVVNKELHAINPGSCRFENLKICAQHPSIRQVQRQKRRLLAHKIGTTFCYDIPTVFSHSILNLWKEFEKNNPAAYQQLKKQLTPEQARALHSDDPTAFCCAYEMVLTNEQGPITVIRDLEEVSRRSVTCCNDRGMVAWEIHFWTPDCITGRTCVVIANDITYAMGSFSMREHNLFYQASVYSRQHNVPWIFVAANSGARIGFAMDVKKDFGVVWRDPQRPEEGFEGLCLSNPTPQLQSQIKSTWRDGKCYIDAIIGKEDDIGVENLVGSGLIAGETSAAYQQIPTYCLVTGRAVGIGAYVARLAHRVVQVEPSHLILTGAAALNSLLGKEIYTSNGQLGGTQIMHNNGVSHAVAQTDLEGLTRIAHWVSYLPNAVSPDTIYSTQTSLSFSKMKPPSFDDGLRLVETIPKKDADPRTILDHNYDGLFDKGSFDEVMDGWAKTIICGRARICGLPIGVIAVETRSVSFEIPADPAAPDSQSTTVHQAAHVWFPDSAFKTSEAINDFNREGLPLVFLANIRGFSGGQKDMFEMVLKFGAAIVDALQSYKQPVVVYIPPHGELRGGAWAVLDTQINPACITMIADPESRGGVLEAEGMVEIKFRQRDIHALMDKCDSQIQELTAKLANATIDDSIVLRKQIEKRREFLMPVYRTIAVRFADLHDTTVRMIAKGAIHDQVPWHMSRNYIYNLLKVKLARMSMVRRYIAVCGNNEPVSIAQLSAGCRWVDENIAEAHVRYCNETNVDITSGRPRFEYTPNALLAYANSPAFSNLLSRMSAQNIRLRLLSNLRSLTKDDCVNIFNELLQSMDGDVRERVRVNL